MSTLSLTQQQIEELLVEIITGKKICVYEKTGQIYAVSFPSVEDRDMSRIVYTKTYKHLQISGLPTIDEMRRNVNVLHMLPDGFYQKLSVLETSITANEKARSLTNSSIQKAELDVALENLHRELRKFKTIEEDIFSNTVDMKAEEVRLSYLVSRCTFHGEELSQRFWPSYEDYCRFTDKVFTAQARYNFFMMNIGIASNTLRALARTQEWKQRWKIAKQTGSQIFSGNSAVWDKNKIALCYWSDFYDTIMSYPTPPPEDIVEDDDKLFEWIREVNRIRDSGGQRKAKSGNGEVTKVNTPYKIRPNTKT